MVRKKPYSAKLARWRKATKKQAEKKKQQKLAEALLNDAKLTPAEREAEAKRRAGITSRRNRLARKTENNEEIHKRPPELYRDVLCENMLRHQVRGLYCDLIILTPHAPLFAHAVVLADASPRLAELLAVNSDLEFSDMRYQLDLRKVAARGDHMTGHVTCHMATVLRYCYTGIVDSPLGPDVDGLQALAEHLGLDSIVKRCELAKQPPKQTNPATHISNRSEMENKKNPETVLGASTSHMGQTPSSVEIDNAPKQEVDLKMEVYENFAVDMEEAYIEDSDSSDSEVGDVRCKQESVDGDYVLHVELTQSESRGGGLLDQSRVGGHMSEALQAEEGSSQQSPKLSRVNNEEESSTPENSDIAKRTIAVNISDSGLVNAPEKTPNPHNPRDSNRPTISHIENVPSKSPAVKTYRKIFATEDGRYKCNECDEAFKTRDLVYRHKRSHHKRKKPNPDNKKKIKTRQGTIILYTPENGYKCDLCDLTFNTQSTVYRHRSIEHGVVIPVEENPPEKPPELPCEDCDKTFRTRTELVSHNRVHKVDKLFTCEYCAKQFRHKQSLMCHIQIHTGQYKHTCDQCGEGFNSKSSFRLHKMRHEGLKPYICERCGASFDRVNSYNFHVSCCGQEKRFTCHICERSYKAERYLRDHMAKHDPDANFPCEVCGRNYKKNKDLLKHMRSKHAAQGAPGKAAKKGKVQGSVAIDPAVEAGFIGEGAEHINAEPGHISSEAGQINTQPGHINAETGHFSAKTRNLSAGHENAECTKVKMPQNNMVISQVHHELEAAFPGHETTGQEPVIRIKVDKLMEESGSIEAGHEVTGQRIVVSGQDSHLFVTQPVFILPVPPGI